MDARQAFCIMSTSILLLVLVALPVQAAEVHVVDGWVRLDPDTDITTNMTFNLSDPDQQHLLNWNQTVLPFINNSSIDGAFVGGFLPPSVLQVSNQSVDRVFLCGVVTFKSTYIMSGSSESWWRVPLEKVDNGSSINLTIWHLGSPDVIDPDTTGTPNNGSHPVKVFDNEFITDGSELNQTYRHWNGTAWTRDFNSTWVRVYTPIHSDEAYYVRWDVNLTSGPYRARFQGIDVGEDFTYKSWTIWPHNSSKWLLECDLDHSVIHTHGMGMAVGGVHLNVNQGDETDPVTITWKTKASETLTNSDYIVYMVPFMEPVDNSSNVEVRLRGEGLALDTSEWVADDGPTDFYLQSFIWTWGDFDGYLQLDVTIYNMSRDLFIYDANSKFYPDFDRDYNLFTVTNHEWLPSDYEVGFHPYCSIHAANGTWVNTHPPPQYYLGDELVDPDQLTRRSVHSDHWLTEIWLDGYEGVARVTAAISFAINGDWDGVARALDPAAPFPTDAPWYLGKIYWKGADFLSNVVSPFLWQAGVWIWEAIQWVVKHAPWFFAGLMKIMVLFVTVPVWALCIQVIMGIIKWGLILASEGVEPAMVYADEFWTNTVKTGRGIIGRVPGLRKVVS